MMLSPSSNLVRRLQLPRYWEWPKPLPASIIPAVKIILIIWFIDTSKEIEIFTEGRTQIKVLRATLTKSLNPWFNYQESL